MHRYRIALLRSFVALVVSAALGLGLATQALAYVDTNGNKIDDIIETVNRDGFASAFLNQDPNDRMLIGVENPAAIVYAVYVGYDHRPTTLDATLMSTTGVSMVWPFVNIDYIESRATYPQVLALAALAGVTRVEAVPVEYAANHYGARVVRSRDSRGLGASQDYALFPSVRQELGFDGTGIVIAILDTGVNDETDQINAGYPGHEGLNGKFLGGGEFWCGQELCSTPVNGSANPQDHGGDVSSYHATHCAGTAMGTGGPAGFFAGVAPGARLVDCKVLSDAGASVGGSTRGLDWCIANRNTLWAGLTDGSIWQGIDVVSMSLGSTQCTGGSGTSNGSDAASAAVNAAVNAGMVVVVATGNDNAVDCIAGPAAADLSIAVGATTHARTLDRADDQVTTFSNEGIRDDDGDADHFDEYKPNVVAPGAGIISASGDVTSDGTAYQQLSGTSMACPHVAGCAALLLHANPALTPLQVRTILQNTAIHDIPSAKATGDRGQDPHGIDPNYDLGSGWGLVDMYAAVKEALDATSGVQVVQLRATADVPNAKIDFRWWTQREHPFLGFNVHRAPDVAGAPGAFVQLNALPIVPTGDPVIQGDDNRTPYVYPDTDPGLVLGQRYWYRVEWIDLLSVAHAEPPVPVAFGQLARVATVYYQIAHNAVDNDLLVRIGSDLDYDPGSLGDADFEVLGPGESAQDSAVVILNNAIPPNTGTSTFGTIDHYWSVGFKQGDGAEPFLHPSMTTPWFLNVTDGGFVNRNGRVTGFSMFVNDAPGSATGTTYVTNHLPMPQPLVEGGLVSSTLWIPEPGATPVAVASFQAESGSGAVRLRLELSGEPAGATAEVFRSISDDFTTRISLTGGPVAFAGQRYEYTDTTVEPNVAYFYWVEVREASGRSYVNGPLEASVTGAPAVTFASPARPNPITDGAVFEYALGADVAGAGAVDVSLVVHDLQGRALRTLKQGREVAGQYRIAWNGSNDHGARVEPGIYYLRFRAGDVVQNVKLSVVR